jgi:type IV pilus assembly protein PilC
MPRYNYRAYDHSGNKVLGSISSSTKERAIEDLSGNGLLITSLRKSYFSLSEKKRVTSQSFRAFNRELIALLNAGIPLVDALKLVSTRPSEPNFSQVLQEVIDIIVAGDSFSHACSRYPNVFDHMFIIAINIGAQSGDLVKSLKHYQVFLERKISAKSTIVQATYYPIFIFSAVLVVMAILFLFVVPSFTELYTGFGAELPMATQLVLNISEAFPVILLGVFALVCIAILAWNTHEKDDSFFRKVDSLLITLPLIGSLRRSIRESQVMLLLSTLLASGINLVNSLDIIRKAFSRYHIGEKVRLIHHDIESGVQFTESASAHKLLDHQMTSMLVSGEKSGSLPDMATQVSSHLEEFIERRIKTLTSLFEPFSMAFLGLLVGFVIISMYLPIFFIADVVE